MNKITRKCLVTLLIILACVAIVQWARFLYTPAVPDPFRIMSRRIIGNPQADIQVIEYVDFRCGPCAYGTMWLKNFMKEHPGSLYVELRYYPLHMSHGAESSRFAECALRQNRFWDVVYALMAQQSKWVRLVNPKDYYLQIAQESGLDIGRLQACWDKPEVFESVIAFKEQGKKLGVKATPTYFINGEMVVGSKDIQKKIYELLGLKMKEEALKK